MPMNLAENPEAVIQAMAEVEGARWLGRQKDGDFKSWSVFDAIQELKGRFHPGSEVPIQTIIYGEDGWNRYVVLESGEVCFIELQAWSKETLEKARKAGFRIT